MLEQPGAGPPLGRAGNLAAIDRYVRPDWIGETKPIVAGSVDAGAADVLRRLFAL